MEKRFSGYSSMHPHLTWHAIPTTKLYLDEKSWKATGISILHNANGIHIYRKLLYAITTFTLRFAIMKLAMGNAIMPGGRSCIRNKYESVQQTNPFNIILHLTMQIYNSFCVMTAFNCGIWYKWTCRTEHVHVMRRGRVRL